MGTPMAHTTITKKTASLKLAVFFSGPGKLATIGENHCGGCCLSQGKHMAFTTSELAQIEQLTTAFVEQLRPPPYLRPQVDLAYRIRGQNIEIFEIRVNRLDPTRKIDSPIAKITYVRTTNSWRLYWLRGNLKWYRYEPGEFGSLAECLSLIKADTYGCFFG